MTGISRITDKIIAEAQTDSRRILGEADKKCAEILAQYKKEADESVRAIEEEAQNEAEKIVTKAKTEAGIIRKNTVNDAKIRLVDRVFDEAKKEILSLSDDKYLEFLINLLVSLLKQINAEGSKGKIEVLLCAKDREKHGKALLEGVSRRLIGKIDSKFLESVALSRATAEISGGIVLATERCDYNCSVESIIEKIRPEIESNIRKMLFEGNSK